MVTVAAVVVAAWVVVALAGAFVLGRALAVSEKSDRWRHGHREVRDLRHLHPVPPLPPLATADRERSAA